MRENIEVSADTTVTLDVRPAGRSGQRNGDGVSAEGPLVDVKSATTDSRIDKELIAKLPTSRDAFYDLALTAPGMFDSSSSNSLPSPTAYGSATNENVFLINGVNATNPEAGAFGTLVNVNYDAVEEVRIVGLGSEGRVRQLLGRDDRRRDQVRQQRVPRHAALCTRCSDRPPAISPGPNDDLGAPWLFVGEGEQLAGETKSDWETSATVGGPIRKDKLWFFGAFDYLRSSSLPPRWSLQNESWNRYVDGKDLGRARSRITSSGARTTTRTTTATAGAGARSRRGTRR